MKIIENFFKEIDKRWNIPVSGKITIRLIGSAAILLQTDYARGTKDSDIFQTTEMTADLQQGILALAGKGSNMHKKYRMYVEFVAEAFPFLPIRPCFHDAPELNEELENFRIEVLDVVDVAVSKINPFRPQDIDDIRALVDRMLIDPEKLEGRFRVAVDRWLMDARAEELPQYIENLHAVQRDILMVRETPVDLPEWFNERHRE